MTRAFDFEDPDVRIRELVQRCSTDSPPGQVVLSRTTTIFLPENYEPGYAYPLIVWVNARGLAPEQLLNNTPHVSTRNYIATCVSLEAEDAPPDAMTSTGLLADRVEAAVKEVRAEYNIHSERVYLVGFDEAATAALELLLMRGEWFAGAFLVGTAAPQIRIPLTRYHHLRRKRVVLASRHQEDTQLRDQLAKLLGTAGMTVQTVSYHTRNRVATSMLQQLNRWIMDGIYSGQPAQ